MVIISYSQLMLFAGVVVVFPLPSGEAWRGVIKEQQHLLRQRAKILKKDLGMAWLSEGGCILAKLNQKDARDINLKELSTGATKTVKLPPQMAAVAQLWPSEDGRAVLAWSTKPGLPELWLWTCPQAGSSTDGSFEAVRHCLGISITFYSVSCALLSIL